MSSTKLISTWLMSKKGMEEAVKLIRENAPLHECILSLLETIENDPTLTSVGFGGLPNINGEVELDSAYMNGDDLSFGGVMGLSDIKNPIKVAYDLSHKQVNCLLCGEGAKKYAMSNNFEGRDNLTKASNSIYLEKRIAKKPDYHAYNGHDTCCVIGLNDQSIHTGVSTAGLFLKAAGRVGDSPIIGSGFYADSQIGGACATGLGEDIMRKCISYEVVRLMSEGKTPHAACVIALRSQLDRLKNRDKVGAISIIAMNLQGEFGAATSEEIFPFVVGDKDDIKVYYVQHVDVDRSILLFDQVMSEKYLGD